MRSAAATFALLCAHQTALAQPPSTTATPQDTTAQVGGAPNGPGEDAPSNSDSSARSDVAFEAGVAAYRKGDYVAAREAFALAYELDPSYRTAAVLGQTEEKLGHLPQAATLLNWALFHMDGSVEPEAKTRIHADLDLLRGRILTLKLKTPVLFQEVLIDDLLFTSNSLRVLSEGDDTWTIYLDPTRHEVTVRAQGYHPQQRQVEGASGQRLDWELRWQPVSETNAVAESLLVEQRTATDLDVAMAAEKQPVEWQLPVSITTSGLALLAAGFGVYSLHQYNDASDEFEKANAVLRSAGLAEPCGAAAPTRTRNACLAVTAADRDMVNQGNRAIVTFSVAGALTLSSAALWLWWWNDESTSNSSTAKWSFAPRVGQTEWGGVLGYRY